MSDDKRKDPYGFETAFGVAFGIPSSDPAIRQRQQLLEWGSSGKRDFEKMHHDRLSFLPQDKKDRWI